MPVRSGFLLLLLWLHQRLPASSQPTEPDAMRCSGGLCIPPELCRPVSINVYDEVHLDFFSSDECQAPYLKCCPFERIVRAPMSDLSDILWKPSRAVPCCGTSIGVALAVEQHSGMVFYIVRTSSSLQDTEAPDENEIVCAARNNNGIGRIVQKDKTRAKYGEFPWMAFVYTAQADYELYLCGGTLVHSKVVLTIAHCIENRTASELRVRLGEWDLEHMVEIYPPQDRAVIAAVTHPQFYDELLLNDIAILFLDEHVHFTEVVGIACLPKQNANFDHKRCLFTGWGEDERGRNSSVLKRTKLPIVPNGQCQRVLRRHLLNRSFRLHPGFLCAGGESGKDACRGDGGSPLVCPIPASENQYYVVGMVAYGYKCGTQGVPGVYVNVPHYRDWIDGEIEKMYHVDIFV